MRQIFAFFLTTLLLCLGVNQVWAEPNYTVYVLTDHLENGGQYLIVNTNSAGAAYAMGYNGTTVSTDNVTISSGTEKTGNKLFIDSEDVAATSVWTASGNNRFVLENGGYYPTAQNNNNAIAFNTSAPSNPWTYSNNRLSASVSNNRTRYLYYNNGFTTNTSRQNVYIYQAIQIEMDPTIKVSPKEVGISAEEKHTATANIYITGINLSNDITVSITQGADMFSINKTSVAKDADGVS
ncbi:MAG: hypothetical protein J5953_00700, partial [Prevotella sp.]|nr:hypothetical protein [Prevotella sp.]